MLQFQNVCKGYGGELLFKEVTLSIGRGEKCGVLGRNGSGKTTLFRLLIGEEELDGGIINRPKDYKIGYLHQHIHFSEPSVLQEASLSLPQLERDTPHRAEKILFGLGFNQKNLENPPDRLSGGYHLRLQLAKVLISEPDCLLLDEPTNYLDIVSIRWLTRFLKAWTRELLIISHERDFMDSVCTHTLGIHRKKILKIPGGTEKYFAQVMQDEEIHEKTRLKLDKQRLHAEEFIRRFGAKNTKAKQAQARQKAIDKMPVLEQLAQLYQLDFNFNAAPFSSQRMVKAEEVNFSYPSQEETLIPLIDNFSLEIMREERIAIIGKNGRGKSTLLQLLLGDLAPLKGMVKLSNNVQIGYFGQTHVSRLNPLITIEDEIAQANPLLKTEQVRATAGVMMFGGEKVKKKIGVLSGGEKSRVLLAKILATPCNLLLLDEPTHHLDMESVEALIEAIDDFPGAVVIVTHSELILRRLPITKLVVCHQNRQHVFAGNYDEFLEKEGWDDEKKIIENDTSKGVDRKQSKQKRAEKIGQRSKALKPLQEKIANIENKIILLENEVQEGSQKLMELSQKGLGEQVAALSKTLASKSHEIESLFLSLEVLSTEYETTKATFQE